MPLPDEIFAAQSNPAVPGGSFAKPLILALLALLAARKFGGAGANDEMPEINLPEKRDAPPENAQEIKVDERPETVSTGLDELVEQLRKSGLGDIVDTWIKPGENKPVESKNMSDALDRDLVDELSQRTGLSRDDVLDGLAKMLPGVVDKMTPEGRVPTQQDLFQLMS